MKYLDNNIKIQTAGGLVQTGDLHGALDVLAAVDDSLPLGKRAGLDQLMAELDAAVNDPRPANWVDDFTARLDVFQESLENGGVDDSHD